MAVERILWDFLKCGFTKEDLGCVISSMKSANKRMSGASFSFRIHRVVGDLEWFASMLGEARAKDRNRKKPITPKETVLQEWHPVVVEQENKNAITPIKELLQRAVSNL